MWGRVAGFNGTAEAVCAELLLHVFLSNFCWSCMCRVVVCCLRRVVAETVSVEFGEAFFVILSLKLDEVVANTAAFVALLLKTLVSNCCWKWMFSCCWSYLRWLLTKDASIKLLLKTLLLSCCWSCLCRFVAEAAFVRLLLKPLMSICCSGCLCQVVDEVGC